MLPLANDYSPSQRTYEHWHFHQAIVWNATSTAGDCSQCGNKIFSRNAVYGFLLVFITRLSCIVNHFQVISIRFFFQLYNSLWAGVWPLRGLTQRISISVIHDLARDGKVNLYVYERIPSSKGTLRCPFRFTRSFRFTGKNLELNRFFFVFQ